MITRYSKEVLAYVFLLRDWIRAGRPDEIEYQLDKAWEKLSGEDITLLKSTAWHANAWDDETAYKKLDDLENQLCAGSSWPRASVAT